jgi:FlaA1/EpsC-like NDP-sugar epimerase
LIDDEAYKKGKNIMGVKVFGSRNDIPTIAKQEAIETILIAIPTIEDEDKKQILELCKKTNCKIEIIPGMYEIINGKVSLIRLTVDIRPPDASTTG